MRCDRCNEEIPEGYTFCRFCGEPVIQNNEPTYVNKDLMKNLLQPESIVYDNEYDNVTIYKEIMKQKDQNNRQKAERENMIQLALIVLGILIAVVVVLVMFINL
jgi:hypothetical protein